MTQARDSEKKDAAQLSPSAAQSDSHSDALQRWDALADWWDQDTREGDAFHRQLIQPVLKRLAQLEPGAAVLDIGCGNGALLRSMYVPGARFVGVDGSRLFVERARERSTGFAITFSEVDATQSSALAALASDGRFDWVLCSMVLHDLPNVEPLLDALAGLLNDRGKFLFAIPHPAFNSCYSDVVQAESPAEKPYIKVKGYIEPCSALEKAKRNQPLPHYNFHRPLTDLFNALLSRGFVMDAFEEPTTSRQGQGELADSLWGKCADIPPVLISRWFRLNRARSEQEQRA